MDKLIEHEYRREGGMVRLTSCYYFNNDLMEKNACIFSLKIITQYSSQNQNHRMGKAERDNQMPSFRCLARKEHQEK